jgi:hypothetical protein
VHRLALISQRVDAGIGLAERGEGIDMLLGGYFPRLPDDGSVIAVRDNQGEDRSDSGPDQSPKGRPFALAFGCFVSMGLLAIGGILSHHAIYTCSYRDDMSYYLFLSLSIAAFFSCGLLLVTICGFFPDSSFPHFNLF